MKGIKSAISLASTWSRYWETVSLILVLLVFYAKTMAPGLSWANRGDDGGDLITAALTSGVPHPTGYPTYLLLASAFLTLPGPNPALKTNWLSAVCAIGASVLVSRIVRDTFCASDITFAKRSAAWVAGVSFGLSGLVWSQAVITEVYTLHALGVATSLWCVHQLDRGAKTRGAGIWLGLALGNHLTSALLLPLFAWRTVGNRKSAEQRLSLWFWVQVLTGVLIYLWLPFRAMAGAPVNWGGANTLVGWIWLVSAESYRHHLFAVSFGEVLVRLVELAHQLLRDFGGLSLVLCLWGLRSPAQGLKWSLFWVVGAYGVLALTYNVPDYPVQLIPVYVACAIWIGYGWEHALQLVSKNLTGFMRAGAALGIAALGCQAVMLMPSVSAHDDQRAQRYLTAVMTHAPLKALVVTNSDRDTFALWYGRFGLGYRPDLTVIVSNLMPYAWYRETLRQTYPYLVVSDDKLTSMESLAVINNLRLCYTRLDIGLDLQCQGP